MFDSSYNAGLIGHVQKERISISRVYNFTVTLHFKGLKRRWEREREARQNELEIQKSNVGNTKKVMLKARIIARKAIILARLPIQCCAFLRYYDKPKKSKSLYRFSLLYRINTK